MWSEQPLSVEKWGLYALNVRRGGEFTNGVFLHKGSLCHCHLAPVLFLLDHLLHPPPHVFFAPLLQPTQRAVGLNSARWTQKEQEAGRSWTRTERCTLDTFLGNTWCGIKFAFPKLGPTREFSRAISLLIAAIARVQQLVKKFESCFIK